MTRTAGVYGIECVPTGEWYVGATTDLNRRRQTHWTRIRTGIHPNPGLDALGRQHTIDAFRWHRLEVIANVPDLERALAEAEHRHSLGKRRASGRPLLSSDLQLYRSRIAGRKSLSRQIAAFKAECRSRGLNSADELCVAMAAHLDALAAIPRPAGGAGRRSPQ